MRIRSLLYVPVSSERFLAKAHERGADAIILDLEDAVAPAQKDAARERLGAAVAMAGRGGATIFVRINSEPERIRRDAEAACRAGASGLFVPKVREPGALVALGLALSDAGRQEEAIAALERQLEQVPDDATAVQELGLIELRRGRWREARERSARAVELNPRLPLGWNDLGVALYQLGQPDAALDAWQRAAELDPRLLDALWNLGTNAAVQGRPEQARRALARFLELAPAKDYQADREKARRLLQALADAAPPTPPAPPAPPGGERR